MTSAELGARSAERENSPDGRRLSGLGAPRSALRAFAALVLSTVLVAPVAAQAPLEFPELAELQVGFNDCFKLGCWTRVACTFVGPAAPLTGVVELTTADGDGVPVRYASQPVQLTPGRQATAVLYARFGQSDAEAKIKFIAADGRTHFERKVNEFSEIALPTPLSTHERLVVCVGRLPTLSETATEFQFGRDRTGVIVAVVADPSHLPTQWSAYEGVDAVVLAPERAAVFDGLTPDGAPMTALHAWLEQGGRVWAVVSDATAAAFAAGAALERFADIEAAQGVALPRTTTLEKLAGTGTVQAITAVELQRRPLLLPRLATADTEVVAAEGDLPLVVRRAVGFGVLVNTTFDPEHALLQAWTGRRGVVRNLLVAVNVVSAKEAADAARSAVGGSTNPNYTTNFGYDDLAGQLRSGLDQYEGVKVVPFFALAMMVLGYLALVGPIDFWFVRRVLKRPELTWITFPAIVVATSLAAYFLAVELKGKELRINRADVVDCDAATGLVRTTSFAGVFSPVGQTYDVRYGGNAPLVATTADDAMTTWFGLPGSGLGGMNAGGGGGGWFAESYFAGLGETGLVAVPIQVWSSKMFTGRSGGRATASLHEPLTEQADGRLRGTLRNPFAADVDEGLLCFGSDAYFVGKLGVGESTDVALLNSRELRNALQGREVVTAGAKSPQYVGGRYDPGNRDVAEILQKMMFYEAAGGREYVELESRYQPLLDFSELPKLNRAVFVGRIDGGAVGELRLSTSGGEADRGSETRTAFVRLVIPVKQAAAE